KQMVKAVGGVIMKSRDGRVTVDNTFEGVLKRKENEIRTEIGTLLFTET
ncbi:MAG TPA: V-type ATP synthase subunit E, partial [Thermoplasmata archaeon]|nr:V-type ATP synthase subunit E [Thermoplasmata archaeon]